MQQRSARTNTPSTPPRPLGRDAVDMLGHPALLRALAPPHRQGRELRHLEALRRGRPARPRRRFGHDVLRHPRRRGPRSGAGTAGHPRVGDFFGEMALIDGEPRSATVFGGRDDGGTRCCCARHRSSSRCSRTQPKHRARAHGDAHRPRARSMADAAPAACAPLQAHRLPTHDISAPRRARTRARGQRDLDPVVVERRAAAEIGVALGDRDVHVLARPEQLRPLLLVGERDAGLRGVVDDGLGA